MVASGNSGDYSDSLTAMPKGQTPRITFVKLNGTGIEVGIDAEGNNLSAAVLSVSLPYIFNGVEIPGVTQNLTAQTFTLKPDDFINQNVVTKTLQHDNITTPPSKVQYSVTIDSDTSGDAFVNTIGSGTFLQQGLTDNY